MLKTYHFCRYLLTQRHYLYHRFIYFPTFALAIYKTNYIYIYQIPHSDVHKIVHILWASVPEFPWGMLGLLLHNAFWINADIKFNQNLEGQPPPVDILCRVRRLIYIAYTSTSSQGDSIHTVSRH